MSAANGAVTYPTHITEVHAEVLGWDTSAPELEASLTDNMLTIVNTMWGITNPYESKSPYDPDTALADLKDDLDYLRAASMGSNELVTWAAMIAQVEGQIDLLVPTDTELDAEVQAMSENQEIMLAQSYNRISAGFFDNLAVISTAFPTAFAVLEAQHNSNLALFESKLRAERNRDRLTAYVSGVSSMTQIMGIRMQSMQNTYQMHDSYAKAKITALNNEISQEADMRENEAFWDLQILQGGATLIGSVAGIPGMSKGMSKWQMALNTIGTVGGVFTGMIGGLGGGISNLLPIVFGLM